MSSTPGPWTYSDGFISGRFASDGEVHDLCDPRCAPADTCGAEMDSNTSLILAAPLMLDALKNISDCGLLDCNCGKPCMGTCTYAMVENAIKAAKGPT